jgi:hypothetical protein
MVIKKRTEKKIKERERRREGPLRYFYACLILCFAGFHWERFAFERGLIVVLLCYGKIV